MSEHLRFQIPSHQIQNEITYLEIEAGDGGFYLFQYERPNSPPKWDSFYATLDEALDDCESAWGISRNSWERQES
ncbi:MAG: hypothetical protein QF848_06450 [Planctomycetota bacterium]|jgi:nitrogen regulatory protein PII-like uncharacterized protein|nr:hypothetical protein [Planctomycetota bacterium]